MQNFEISTDGRIITVTIPMTFKSRGGRKVMIAPDGRHLSPSPRPRIDNNLIRALVKAFRWKDMLDSGAYATVSELARAEKKDTTTVSHVLRLTLLAPEIVEAILDGRQPPEMQVQALIRKGLPLEWERQKAVFAGL